MMTKGGNDDLYVDLFTICIIGTRAICCIAVYYGWICIQLHPAAAPKYQIGVPVPYIYRTAVGTMIRIVTLLRRHKADIVRTKMQIYTVHIDRHADTVR
jgi:hypothetical protein